MYINFTEKLKCFKENKKLNTKGNTQEITKYYRK